MSTPLLNPGDPCGGHEIVRCIGTGRTSEVYAARAPGGELRAFKIMSAPGIGTRQARFAQEGEALAMMVSAHVLRVYDVGLWGDRIWLSLELFEGETLAQRLHAGPVPLDELLHLIDQVCDGLAEAHRLGIVHRDLTPENILVGPGGMVKVFDFGMAKLQAFGVVTTLEQQIGSARYMAPERARSEPADPGMDVYALGNILYEGIGGEHPMGPQPRTMLDTVRWQIWEHARPLGELVPGVSSELASLVHQMLEKDPTKRPTSMRQVQARLREERARLRAPQRRAARNAAQGERPFALAPTAPMPSMPEVTVPEAQGSERDRAALLPAAWPMPASVMPAAAMPVAARPEAAMPAAVMPAAAMPAAAMPEAVMPEARRPADSALGLMGGVERRSTEVPVESAARPSRVTPRRASAAAVAISVVALAAAAGWTLFGAAAGPASPAQGGPRPAPAPAPVPSAAAPTASASTSAATPAPPASARTRAPWKPARPPAKR